MNQLTNWSFRCNGFQHGRRLAEALKVFRHDSECVGAALQQVTGLDGGHIRISLSHARPLLPAYLTAFNHIAQKIKASIAFRWRPLKHDGVFLHVGGFEVPG